MNYIVLTPDRNVLAGRTVTSTAGTPDPDHRLDWLTDQRPAYPVRYNSGAWGLSVSIASKAVQLVVLANHSLNADVTVGGDVSGTISPSPALENGAYLNPYLMLDAPVAGVTALTLAGTNTQDMVLGEAFAGVPVELKPFLMSDFSDDLYDTQQQDSLVGEFYNVPMFDGGTEWRVFGGSQIYTTAERDFLLSWRRAQRTLRFPSVLIMKEGDARVVLIGRPQFKQGDGPDLWQTQLTFIEFPRYRWNV